MSVQRGRFNLIVCLQALFVAGLLFFGATSARAEGEPLATAADTDVTDLWWNPAEPGWGLQMINIGDHVFATIFVYGPDNKPSWFVGELERIASTAPLRFAGKLLATTGPYFGAPYGSAPWTVREAGTMAFELSSVNAGQLSYVADGVQVNQPVQRQPLWLDNYDGAYLALVAQTTTNCNNPAFNGNATGLIGITIRHTGLTMSLLTVDLVTGGCTAAGVYFQLGRLGQFQGAYSCSSNDYGSTEMTEMTTLAGQFSGRIKRTSTLSGCVSSGRITGLIPN